MTMKIERWSWEQTTRRCDFSFSLQGGAVFADFNRDVDGLVYLVRISFDGYGCCDTALDVPRLTSAQSETLIALSRRHDVDVSDEAPLFRSYFDVLKGFVWPDALQEHGLLS